MLDPQGTPQEPNESDLVDVVDDHDHPIGTMRRGDVRTAGANFRVAHVFVFDRDARLLLQQLGVVRTKDPFKWGSSVAAHVLASENYEVSAERRMRAELGIDPSISPVTKICLQEGDSKKFVVLFTAHSDRATIGEPLHSAALEYRDLKSIQTEISIRPRDFTETFRALLDVYLQSRSISA
jgi:isopentenyl-diphosphate delta-isomerase